MPRVLVYTCAAELKRKMRAMLAVVLVLCAVTRLQAAELQHVQDAQPLNVDLSSQSDTALANSAGTEIDDTNLGGYRPLYPPYFPREPSTQSVVAQPKSVYYDQEYYTRGAHPGLTDDRLDRQLKTPTVSSTFLPSTGESVYPAVESVVPVGPPVIGGRRPFAGNPFLQNTQPTLPGVQPISQSGLNALHKALNDDRNNRQIEVTNSRFSHSASSSFSSSYSFQSVKFPSS